MNFHTQHQSATIYQFPVGGRAGLNASRDLSGKSDMPAASSLALTDAWYHQVAIQQDAATRTEKH